MIAQILTNKDLHWPDTLRIDQVRLEEVWGELEVFEDLSSEEQAKLLKEMQTFVKQMLQFDNDEDRGDARISLHLPKGRWSRGYVPHNLYASQDDEDDEEDDEEEGI